MIGPHHTRLSIILPAKEVLRGEAADETTAHQGRCAAGGERVSCIPEL